MRGDFHLAAKDNCSLLVDFSRHVEQTQKPVLHPGGRDHGREEEEKEEGERPGEEEESLPEEV